MCVVGVESLDRCKSRGTWHIYPACQLSQVYVKVPGVWLARALNLPSTLTYPHRPFPSAYIATDHCFQLGHALQARDHLVHYRLAEHTSVILIKRLQRSLSLDLITLYTDYLKHSYFIVNKA